MKLKHTVAIVAAMAVIATATLVAAEKHDAKSGDGIYRLKSNGQVVAELRVVAPAQMQFFQFEMKVGGGRTIWRAKEAGKPVTGRLVTGVGNPVEFSAGEIELDHEVPTNPPKNPEKK